MTIARILCVSLLAIAVAGCQTAAKRPLVSEIAVSGILESTIGKENSTVPPTARGTLFGEYYQTDVGGSLIRADRKYAEDVARQGLGTSPNGQTLRWNNPSSGHTGTFTPINSYHSLDRLHCRDYALSVTVDGRTQEAFGTACQNHQGTWKIVEPPITRQRPERRRRRT